jgi:hypothetical protein
MGRRKNRKVAGKGGQVAEKIEKSLEKEVRSPKK